jgi:hypothetical protein
VAFLSLAAFALGESVSGAARADDVPTFADRAGPSALGGDRSFAVLVNPLAMACATFGAEGDFVVAPTIAVAVEVDAVHLPAAARGTNAASVSVGFFAYPWASALHGFYASVRVGIVRPWREPAFRIDGRRDVVELGGLVGWHWTWDYGLSLRVGAGPLLAVGGPPPFASVSPELIIGRAPARLMGAADASVGWAF